MTRKTFERLVKERTEKIHNTLTRKGKEYAQEYDVFHNFIEASRMSLEPSTKESALWGMLLKHLVSIIDIIKGKKVSHEVIDEKIGDAVNYLILLEGMLKEEHHERN